MNTKGLTRREFLRGAALTGVGLVAAACAPAATPTEAPTAMPVKDKIVVGMEGPSQVH